MTAARPDLAGAQVIGMTMTDVLRQAIADPATFREEMTRHRAETPQQARGAMRAAQTQQDPMLGGDCSPTRNSNSKAQNPR